MQPPIIQTCQVARRWIMGYWRSRTATQAEFHHESYSGGFRVWIFDRSPENVQIKVIDDTISENGITIVITDNNKTPYNWGENYKIEQKNNDIWEEIKPNKNVIVNSVNYNVDENNQITYRINWNEYYGTLEKGIYRIVKSVSDNDTNINIYSDEFEIQ